MVRNPPANVGDAGDAVSISGSGGSLGVGNGNPLQCSRTEESGGLQSTGSQRVGRLSMQAHGAS